MKITTEELQDSYRRMSDAELLALDRGELTDMARNCYDEELRRRGLETPGPAEASGGPEEEPLVIVEDCASADEAWAIQSTLESAGIAARIGNPSVPSASWPNLEIGHFPVAVPASLVEDARRVLGAQIPDAIIITARYEDGVFKPLEEVAIEEGAIVEVHVPSTAIS